MRLSVGIIVCLLITCSCLKAQRVQYGHIKGTVIDSSTRLPLESASVSAFLTSDSSFINYALSNRKGEFIIRNIPAGKSCWYMISYKGYVNVAKGFIIPVETKELLLGTISLLKTYAELEEITVVAQRPPVMVKEDTLEFNAGSFKTMPNAVVEDILKQLPGFDLDKEGNITVNGKKVTRLTVDGKEFFGGDPKIALKNLPKEIIDKIQVADNKTREAQFNKTSDGNEDLVINLTLRKEIKQGWFGRAGMGYGTDNRYAGNATINFLKGTKQLNFIGNVNNTSRSTYSGDFNISSSQNSLRGGGNGIVDNKAAGLNFSDNISEKWKLSSSYFFNRGSNKNVTASRRQNILPDTSFFYNADNTTTNNNTNHRWSLNTNYTIDSLTELHFNSSFNSNRGNAVTVNKALSEGLSGNKINSSENILSSESEGSNFSTRLFLGHRFKKQGRGFTIGLNYSYNNRSSIDDNIGANIFYKTDSADIVDSINQRSNSTGTGKNISLSLTYSEPIVKNVNLLVQHSYQKTTNVSGKVTNRFNQLTGKYDTEDSAFTNAFRNVTETHRPTINLGYNKEKLRVSVGAGWQLLSQDNFSATDNSNLHQYYVNFTPSARLSYHFSKTGSVNLYYSGRNQQPSIMQLQPVPDNSNPLYVRLGNPDLQPSFYHNINLNIRQSKGTTFWHGGINTNITNNQVIYETFYDEFGRQVSKPLNVNGNYRVSGNLSFSKSWKRGDWSLRLNLYSRGTFDKNVTYTNKIANTSKGLNLSQSVGISYTYKQILSVQPSFNIHINNTRYSLQTIRDAEYVSKAFSLSVFWNNPKRLIIENSLQYNYNSRIAPGFRKGVTMWSAAINYQLFKQQQATMRLAVYDILKQNAGINRVVTETYIEDRSTQVLQQYFMLSFIYNLRSFGR